ncbi:MAG: penicillin-binding transpeptidase domain-containing protein [Candidatus Promineifilaceae bacterium]
MSRMGWERPEDWEEQAEYEGSADLRGRLFFLRLLVVVTLGILLGRVIWLQQTQVEGLTAAAIDNQIATITQNAPRGVIFDRNGILLAENLASFDVSVTLSKLPTDDVDRRAVFERLSLLTGVPITNTVAQQALGKSADPAEVGVTSRLASLYSAPISGTLNSAGIIPQLPTSIEEVVRTFSFDPFNPHVITRNVPITLARVIEQESVFMPGVSVVAEPVRNYPTGALTSHIIGFMGPIPDLSYVDRGYERDDRVGLFGLESSQEEFLKGVKGERTIEVDATGREQRQIGVETPPTAGYNLHLTVDAVLQGHAEDTMQAWLQWRRDTPDRRRGELEVESASLVALNPKTGEVLAMVDAPTFDNNRFATEIPVEYYLQLDRDDYLPLFNHAIGGQYPPGSTFKILTGAAALQEGIVSPSRLLDTPGSIVIPNRFSPNDPGRAQRFVCWIWNTFVQDDETGLVGRGEHEAMNMYTALAQSCDIYFYKVSGGFRQDGEVVDALGIERLKRYANQFGFGTVQGIELPAEAAGNIPSQAWKQTNFAEPWSTGDDYNTSIGQGFVTATPLQIAQMAGVIASGGFLYRPSIVHHLTDDDGNVVLFDAQDNPIFASPGEDGLPVVRDESGNVLDPARLPFSIAFDSEGNYIRPPELINVVEIDRENLDVIAEGMRLVNQGIGTASFIGEEITVNPETGGVEQLSPWLTQWGIESAGKTGTAEYCDNIAITRGWCFFDKLNGERQVQPAHAWYVGYAPFDDPEIVVAAFMFNGEEGSETTALMVRDVLKAYFKVDQYAEGAVVEP